MRLPGFQYGVKGEYVSNKKKESKKKSWMPALAWVAIVAAGLALAGYWWAGSRQAAQDFDQLAKSGKAALASVKVDADYGRNHSRPGEPLMFQSDPPTSGTHWPSWTEAGFFSSPQPKEKLVHSLEHGNVVIYYDKPAAETLKTLKAWAKRFQGQWDGLVVVPKQGLGEGIILTAWAKVLHQDKFDAAAAAAFVDAFRGRGPENPVR